ncbi:hypothetical protein PFICI_07048 [Pestalotiopsis fici W106-1]|uniref:Zn(2)-C6 fungal-type domain-containing protein n=1 Tax=Pestalotiopsis fici (strain W106-1 / CGMCC3.15140) TaxID=1229662 RepID=W3XA44_PESFW|nr:uncharacterized protein PFICI_07048 [Pestalotiopsis fici W106-1]ETS82046.1 hypothetical protein PFICI_07048 [Pestalotiopsis fici W106-1]
MEPGLKPNVVVAQNMETLAMASPNLDRPTMITPGAAGPKTDFPLREKRHCWECMRRRLVCDSAPGACNKCKTRGVVCPGYDDKKPLRWLTPGKVKSKPRRPKNAPEPKPVSKKSSKEKAQTNDESTIPVVDMAQGAVERYKWQNDVSDIVQAVAFYNNWIYPAWDSTREIASTSWITPLPLGVLNGVEPAISHSLTFCTLSYRFTQLSSPTSIGRMEDDQLAIATKMYYHRWVTLVLSLLLYPILHGSTASKARGRAAYMRPFDVTRIGRGHPPQVHSREAVSAVTNLILAFTRDIAVRALSEALSDPKRKTNNVTLLAVFIFLMVDIAQARMNWRHHYDGLATLIRIRGGLTKNLLPDPYHTIVMAYYFVTGVIGNTTSPAHDLAEPFMFIDNMDMIAEYYGDGRFPTLMCPPDMFLSIARVNHLRAQAAQPIASQVQTLKPRAEALVKHIDDFQPEDWAYSLGSSEQENLLLLARIYQSATMVFCLSSLQSVRVLPRSAAVQTCKARHHQRLLQDLREGLCKRSLRFRDVLIKCIMWPLMIAGTELRNGSLADRNFIERELENMSPTIGSYLPVYALSLIKRFWQSDEVEWDECFDEPRAFVT